MCESWICDNRDLNQILLDHSPSKSTSRWREPPGQLWTENLITHVSFQSHFYRSAQKWHRGLRQQNAAIPATLSRRIRCLRAATAGL
jgi:hypothetical protein